MFWIVASLIAVLALSAFVGCGAKENTEAVSTDGSTSMEKVIGALGESFQNETGISFTYNPTGSGSGIQAVQEGRCDIGLSSRDLKDEEKAAKQIDKAVKTMKATNEVYALIVEKDTFESYTLKSDSDNSLSLTREDAIKIVNTLAKINVFQNDGLFVLSIFELGNFALF